MCISCRIPGRYCIGNFCKGFVNRFPSPHMHPSEVVLPRYIGPPTTGTVFSGHGNAGGPPAFFHYCYWLQEKFSSHYIYKIYQYLSFSGKLIILKLTGNYFSHQIWPSVLYRSTVGCPLGFLHPILPVVRQRIASVFTPTLSGGKTLADRQLVAHWDMVGSLS